MIYLWLDPIGRACMLWIERELSREASSILNIATLDTLARGCDVEAIILGDNLCDPHDCCTFRSV
jgi:hypothetical protein